MAGELHVKKGDTVIVITGKDKGSRGKVIETLPEKGRVLVQGLNMIKRHQRPNSKHPTGGIIEKEAAINASNIRLVCPKCNESVRARRMKLNDGKPMRKCPKCGEVYD